MTDNLKNLEEKLKIDEHHLEVALREHPDLFYKVATEVALAMSKRDGAKYELGEVEAEIDKQLRQAAQISDTKTTEKEIESNKKLDKKVKLSNENFLRQSLEAAKWSALREAYEQRSYALSKLVDLYLANYYSNQDDSRSTAMRLKDAKATNIKNEMARKRIAV